MSSDLFLVSNALIGIPAAAAIAVALEPAYRRSAIINLCASGATFLFALVLLVVEPESGGYLFVDDLNIVFIVLSTFIGFTTSVYSASYIDHEMETGRLTTRNVRFYHAMYQSLMCAMNLALLASNIGLMWVAVEVATLTTVLMVGMYRTPHALEAAWKYFILGSVGIALALFGTILIYMAAEPVLGQGYDAMVWTTLMSQAPQFNPRMLNVAFVFLMLGYGTKVGLAPMHAWLPDAHAEGPTPISAVLVRPPAQCRALCGAAVQDAADRECGGDYAGPADDHARPCIAHHGGLHALPPRRHQAAVRLLLHRAHGHHRLRLRHGRTARQLRRSAAHDDAQPDEVRDLLLGRPHRAGQGHAEDRRHQRTDAEPSGARLVLSSSASSRSSVCRRSASS